MVDMKDSEENGREERIEDLKKKLDELSDGSVVFGNAPDLPPEIEEDFLKYVVDFENAEQVSPLQVLTDSGISLPSPEQLDDEALTCRLWEMIEGLATQRVYLHSTDHLSNRELYSELWNDHLQEPTVVPGPLSDFNCHIDLAGSGSEEDIEVYLRFYADEEDRAHWAQEWPDEPIPDHEPLPFDRDRHLPDPYRERDRSS